VTSALRISSRAALSSSSGVLSLNSQSILWPRVGLNKSATNFRYGTTTVEVNPPLLMAHRQACPTPKRCWQRSTHPTDRSTVRTGPGVPFPVCGRASRAGFTEDAGARQSCGLGTVADVEL
jgi:hypothetical protein